MQTKNIFFTKKTPIWISTTYKTRFSLRTFWGKVSFVNFELQSRQSRSFAMGHQRLKIRSRLFISPSTDGILHKVLLQCLKVPYVPLSVLCVPVLSNLAFEFVWSPLKFQFWKGHATAVSCTSKKEENDSPAFWCLILTKRLVKVHIFRWKNTYSLLKQ